MKLFFYILLFLGILGIVGFGFFTMTTPDIQQTPVHKELDPKDAFRSKPLSPMPTDLKIPTPAPDAPPLTEE